MYSIQRLLHLQVALPEVDEVVFYDPADQTGTTALLTHREWHAMGKPTFITTKIEPGDTRTQNSFMVDL